jgi:hypothetical protein
MRLSTERGFVLTIVLGIGLICAVLAYSMLFSAVADARRNRFVWERNPGRYAVEAGIVWGVVQLMNDPGWTNGTVPIGAGKMQVEVAIPACGGGPCPPRQITATVSN